ncbi:hypothetical protein MKQ70_10900 [Chitinophaga sedimenti]|uniref:hypothetical protein n=1 Tax=Chitinophaga sedimenti TaxID=2033606 RepID=UPI002002A33E|nr:hypothetical protein [Chitinophaga sedimenti]MCK7555487.1 hypothetical protein [Chitinophaga sedimenti]
MKKTLLLLLLLPALLARGQNTWPKDIKLSDGGRLTIYQPQPESLKGNQLTGRSAVSVKKTGTAEPLFGAIWFNAVLNTDKDTRMATLESPDITNARFADSTGQTDVNAIAALIEKEIPKWQMEISLDQLLTTLQQEQRDDAGLNNEPPDILYRDKAATLVLFDGEPQVSQDENLKLDRVVNTPFLVVKDPKARQYYLYASNFWYTAGSPTGPYAHVKKLPSFLSQLDREVRAGEKEDANLQASDLPTQPTEIVVSTKPAELLQTDGPATYQSVAGTGLYMLIIPLMRFLKILRRSERTRLFRAAGSVRLT